MATTSFRIFDRKINPLARIEVVNIIYLFIVSKTVYYTAAHLNEGAHGLGSIHYIPSIIFFLLRFSIMRLAMVRKNLTAFLADNSLLEGRMRTDIL